MSKGGPATNQVNKVDVLQGIVLSGISQCIPNKNTPSKRKISLWKIFKFILIFFILKIATFLKIACFVPWIEKEIYGKVVEDINEDVTVTSVKETTDCDDTLC